MPGALIVADGSKDPRKRAVVEVDARARAIRHVPRDGWTLAALLDHARRQGDRAGAPALVAIDAVLGVPRRFFDLARRVPRWSRVVRFPDWLALLAREAIFTQAKPSAP
jgi:hypothetical protein